ncbi:MAG: tRNA (adenosine(37)-N6)-threonylcarbamoyltransferase complex dimerization subunit type 1 TsaB [Firmicutes bacterium]|nr:tRNA (adenosine(37)-N6)-threonylcarbamoyltransferase complex dimerization subunit type 1 TsaB [Bacillota bacterium]
MLVLGFDTSTDWGVLGLAQDGVVLAETGWQVGRNQAERFLPVLAEMMDRLGLTPEAVDLLAVGCGPGSYTGLRSGLAMAEALSFALDRAVTGVPTLAALAENGAGFSGPVCPTIPARRGEVYAALYRGGEEIIKPAPFRPEDLLSALSAWREEPILLLGGGATGLVRLPEAGSFRFVLPPPEHHLLRGGTVARLGWKAPSRPARPLYLRRTEAEERLREEPRSCR